MDIRQTSAVQGSEKYLRVATQIRIRIYNSPIKTIQGEITMDFEGYCVKCHKKQTIKNGIVKETTNGRQMVQGTCPVCKTKVNRFLANKKAK